MTLLIKAMHLQEADYLKSQIRQGRYIPKTRVASRTLER